MFYRLLIVTTYGILVGASASALYRWTSYTRKDQYVKETQVPDFKVKIYDPVQPAYLMFQQFQEPEVRKE
jgi:hypothetical protein